MIVGDALKSILDGVLIDVIGDNNTVIQRALNFHYGDQKELNKWITLKNSSKLPKYPLTWYVIAPYTESNGWIDVESKLIILTNTQPEWLNTQRKVKTYTNIIEPTWVKVKELLTSNPYIEVLGNKPDKFLIKDEPNFGIDTNDIRLSQNDFTSTKKVGEKGITLDVVDGRIIRFRMRIKADCLITNN